MKTVWYIEYETLQEKNRIKFLSFEEAKSKAIELIQTHWNNWGLLGELNSMIDLDDPTKDHMLDPTDEYEFSSDKLCIRLTSEFESTGQDNAISILKILQENKNISYTAIRYRANISLKAMERHIELLRSLGYDIEQNGEVFSLKSYHKPSAPFPKFGTSAYPLMVLHVLEDSKQSLLQNEIIKKIETSYGVCINRKAIGRNIEVLKAWGYVVEHQRDGYVLRK